MAGWLEDLMYSMMMRSGLELVAGGSILVFLRFRRTFVEY